MCRTTLSALLRSAALCTFCQLDQFVEAGAFCVGLLHGGFGGDLTGYAVWAPGSAVIKALTVFCFCRTGKKLLSGRNLWALPVAAVVCIGGYYLYGSLITGNFAAPLADVTGNVMQSLCSSVLFAVLAAAADKMSMKKYL